MGKYFLETGDGHYDARFYVRILSRKERTERLRILLASLTRTMNTCQIYPILMHDALIGWHWNKSLLPCDSELDVSVRLKDLERLHDQKLTWLSDIWPVLWEINPNFRNRRTMNSKIGDACEENMIDARLIDPSTGVYVNVTALARSSAGIVSTKCPHHYRDADMFPAQKSVFEGVLAYVPKEPQRVLSQEYGDGVLFDSTFRGYTFDKQTAAWIPTSGRDLQRLPVDCVFTQDRDLNVIERVISERPGNVVELGCANGMSTRRLAISFPNRIIFAVDKASPINSYQAHEQPCAENICILARNLPNVRVIHADAATWDFKGAEDVRYLFIDDDHTYNGVKVATENALKHIPRPVTVIWHDCYSGAPDWIGVQRYAIEQGANQINGTWVAVRTYHLGENVSDQIGQ